MRVISSIKSLRKIIQGFKSSNKTIGLVPTMGALHNGHLSLVRAARAKNDVVIVSIFVNPIQFGKTEDIDIYPRDIKADKRLLRAERVDYIFLPTVERMYRPDFSVNIVENKLSAVLCGKYRLNHFSGVCTVVAKLFNLVQPDNAYFGRKDYQQALIIQRMVTNLNYNIKINVMPIVRELDGLAMSSRNEYLTERQRVLAANIYKTLKAAKTAIKKGESRVSKIKSLISAQFSIYNIKVQYIEICAPDNLKAIKAINGKAVILVAVFIGKVRLIDNIEVTGVRKRG